MPSIQDRRVGRLVAYKMVHKNGKAAWECRCDCGNVVIVASCNLHGSHTRSCGCLHAESLKGRPAKHRMSGSSTYQSWLNMRSRCRDAEHPQTQHYFGRGIKVCERWLHSFENFLEDMGEKPSLKHSLDRINNDGNYEPSNCRWATWDEQANNKRCNVLWTLGDKTQTAAQWSKDLGINRNTLEWRIAAGWPLSKALTQEVRKRP